jgi:hypothetical protein|tara:strand:+ start:693 stop:1016 length:324 start_codon:yes stop_codon:yes gene_type:complete
MIYKIFSHHYAPKDSHKAVQFFVDAKDEDELYGKLREEFCWDDREDDDEDFKKKIISCKGSDDEEVTAFEDLYYGLTTYSWEECKDLSQNDFEVLEKAGLTKITTFM